MARRHPLLGLVFDRGGNAAVEFALLAPVLILMVTASFEIAILLFVGGTVESAVLAASRYGITGFTEEGVSREERIRAIIADRTLGFVAAEAADIRTLVYPSFDQIGRPEPFTDANRNGARDPGEGFTDTNGNGQWDEDMGLEGSGGPGDIVLYEVEYQTGAITRLLEPIFGRIVFHAAVAVRNEPF